MIASSDFTRGLLPALFLFLIGFVGCKSSSSTTPDVPVSPQGVAEAIAADPQYALLSAAIARGGIADQLKAANLTVFAPTDAAFQAAGITSAAAINALPVATVKDLLLYHVLNGKVMLANVPMTGPNNLVMAANKGTMFLSRPTATSLVVNGVPVIKADMAVANGIIHQIGRVLAPSQSSFLAAAAANPNLTYLVAAVSRVAGSSPTLAAVLSSTSTSGVPATLFAPTNAAFIAAGYKTIADINAIPVSTLSSLLAYHAVSGIMFSNQFVAGKLTTFSNSAALTVATGASGAVTLKGNQNTAIANLLPAPGRDVPVPNGVLHTIDMVLKP